MQIDYNRNVQHQKKDAIRQGCKSMSPISWDKDAILHDPMVLVVLVVHMRPRAIPLAMITI